MIEAICDRLIIGCVFGAVLCLIFFLIDFAAKLVLKNSGTCRSLVSSIVDYLNTDDE